jgi:hypothetical protein
MESKIREVISKIEKICYNFHKSARSLIFITKADNNFQEGKNMAKKIMCICLLLLLIILTSCTSNDVVNTNATNSDDKLEEEKVEVGKTEVSLVIKELIKQPEIYVGKYEGILPSASGTGMKITLNLTENMQYIMNIEYIALNETFEKSGSFIWDEDKKIVSLIENEGYYFLVKENFIEKLDVKGNRINSKNNYLLNRIK